MQTESTNHNGLLIIFLVVVAVVMFFFVPALNRLNSVPLPVQHESQQQSSQYVVTGQPTVSADFIDKLLCKYDSPACGKGHNFFEEGVKYGIDPAYALAFFWHESNFGKNGMARTTLNIGNLRSSPIQDGSYRGYALFKTWEKSITAWYMLISSDLYVQAGLVTVEQIVPRYAPTGDSNTPSDYISDVEACVALWRSGTVAVA